MFKLHNTLTRQIEEFKPLKAGEVGMYTCGPTVYWDAHIGNFRTYVFEDVLQRVLELEGYAVKRVQNITDVGHLTSDEDEGEDKMEKGAAREGLSVWDIAEKYTQRFLDDAAALNIKIPPKPFLCRATDHIQEQIDLIKTLEEKGFTYKTSDGIYFDTSKYPDYGKLSGQKSAEKSEGARVAANPEKRNKTDFALWKLSTQNKKRLMEWDSPWGVGFPGWHVECSAMARKYLGQPFDIHCGGVDHIPVHHENEIAQSEAAYGVKLANYWLHGEFLLMDNQKMSKSLENISTLQDLVAKGFEPLDLRYFYLGAHYRQKQNFTLEALAAAQSALRKLRNFARGLEKPRSVLVDVEAEFLSALHEDLNIPKALAVVWKLVDGDYPSADKAATLLWMDKTLGLSLDKYVAQPIEVPDGIKALLEERRAAREGKDWKTADEVRQKIEDRGWTVEDDKDGQRAMPND
ncbi:MAG: cysteine--tRNA ligase [Patescibacteria group bacterium]